MPRLETGVPKPYDFFGWSGFGGSGRIVTFRPSVRSTCGFRITRSPAATPVLTSTEVPKSRFHQ